MNKDSTFMSERLYFRGINETDTDRLVAWRSAPEVIRYFKQPKPLTKENHEKWYENVYCQNLSRFDFIIMEKESKEAIGTVGVGCVNYEKRSCEISCMIAESDFQRKGYAVEAIAAMMKMMMKEDITCFFAEVHRENIASRKTIEKLKYVPYGEQLPFIIYFRQETGNAAHSC